MYRIQQNQFDHLIVTRWLIGPNGVLSLILQKRCWAVRLVMTPRVRPCLYDCCLAICPDASEANVLRSFLVGFRRRKGFAGNQVPLCSLAADEGEAQR